MTKWVDHKHYSDSWETISTIPGGAQGNSYIATKGNETAFLKALKSNNDDERRARFYQEASAYFGFDHPRLPSLLESNALHFRDRKFKLYLVCEKIEGESLENKVTAGGSLGYEGSLEVAFGLIEVLEYLHGKDYVHRDVKPGNIILRAGKAEGVVLVDLGIGHDSQNANKTHDTDVGQELGNRFLRLPELSVGSGAKRDPRTDIAFAAGILLYCISGDTPASLLDQDGKMPHQRDDIVRSIEEHVPDYALLPLLSLFDKAFSFTIASRYATARELRDALEVVQKAKPQTSEPSATELMTMLENKISSAKNANLGRVKKSLELSYSEVSKIYQRVVGVAGSVLLPIQTNQHSSNTAFATQIGFVQSGDRTKVRYVQVDISAAGGEIVVELDGEVVHRTSLDEPTFDKNFVEATTKKFASTALSVEGK